VSIDRWKPRDIFGQQSNHDAPARCLIALVVVIPQHLTTNLLDNAKHTIVALNVATRQFVCCFWLASAGAPSEGITIYITYVSKLEIILSLQ
jgi:hypothetical protein